MRPRYILLYCLLALFIYIQPTDYSLFKKSANTKNRQEKPTNCVSKTADVLDKFFSRQTLMRIQWILWYICNYYEFTTPINSKCGSICYRLAGIPMSKYDPQFDPLFEGVKNGTNRNVIPTFLFQLPSNATLESSLFEIGCTVFEKSQSEHELNLTSSW